MELRAIKYFYTGGHLVELEDDVLSIVSQVRALTNGKVSIHLEPTTGHYLFVEHCDDRVERLIFVTPELDGRCIERLVAGDSGSRSYRDPYDFAEAEQDRLHREADERLQQAIAQEAERLLWAQHKDGENVPMAMPVTRLPRHRRRHNAGLSG